MDHRTNCLGGTVTGRRVVTWREIRSLQPAGQNPDDIKTAILKYIPAEIVMAFVAADAAMNSAASVPGWLPWFVFGILWVLTPIYTWRTTKEPDKKLAKAQIVVATISFFVWVITLGGPFSTIPGYSSLYGGVFLPIWTIVPPIALHGSQTENIRR